MKRTTISWICVLTFVGISLTSSSMADDRRDGNVNVSFGLWDPNKSDLVGAPLDRLVGDPAMGVGVDDIIIPQRVTIKEGDSVNFIIVDSQDMATANDKTKPEDIDTSVIEPATNCPQTAGGVINDPDKRIYRGPCFSTNVGTTPPTTITRRDGVEVVRFTKPGTFLVICARKNHFNPAPGEFQMFGFVRVVRDR